MPSPDPKRKRPAAPPPPPPGTSTGSDTEASPSTARPHSAPAAIGEYRVLGELGRGGMGVVYRAEDSQLRREVALKVMLPQFAANPLAKARFVREARAQAKVEHDHVAVIHHIGEHAGVPFLVMPLLKGMTLQEALKANPRPPLAEVVRMAREVAEGLAAAHEQGLVHRDIKPANVWLEGTRLRVKVLDFGLARVVSDAEAASSDGPVTSEGAVLGTPLYMSPEQARGLTVDARTDLWSLGVILYQMTTGQLPFRGRNTLAILTALGADTPPAPNTVNPAVPLALSDLVMRLLAKSPDGRPASAEAVVEQLRQIELGLAAGVRVVPLDSLAGSVPPTGPDPFAELDATEMNSVMKTAVRTASPSERNTQPRGFAVWAIAAVALVAVVGIVWLVAAKSGKKPQPEVVQQEEPKPNPPAVTPKPKDKVANDAERKVAEWVLSIGGNVKFVVAGNEREVKTLADLPTGGFQLTWVHLNDNDRVTDTGLEHLKNCPNLGDLYIGNTKVTDAGLKFLPSCTALRMLDLGTTAVTDAGLDQLKTCTQLRSLRLNATKIGDAAFDRLAGMPELSALDVAGNTRFTPAGLAKLQKLTGLRSLNLSGCDLTDTHLASLKELPVTHLMLVTNPRLTGDALANLGGMKSLINLTIDGAAATDAGLKAIADGLPALQFLTLSNTSPALTNDGIAHLSRTRLRHLRVGESKLTPETCTPLPRCVIDLNGKQIEPSDVHWREANRLLARGGFAVTMKRPDGATAEAKSPADLPDEPFDLVGVTRTATVPPPFGDDDLKRLEQVPTLVTLSIPGSQITDAGLRSLPAFKTTLANLDIRNAAFTGAGLRAVGELTELVTLNIADSTTADAGLAHLAGLPKLENLTLFNTDITDAGVETLATMKSLKTLNLTGTRVTEAGRDKLRSALPGCTVEWEDANRTVATWLLSRPGFKLTLDLPDGKRIQVEKPGLLPAGPFVVTEVRGDSGGYGDADFRRLSVLPGLATLDLYGGGQLTDDGLEVVKRMPSVTTLNLQLQRGITDRGMAHLRGSTRFRSLYLEHTGVGDAGLAELAGNRDLEYLHLGGTKVTEGSLETIAGFKKLQGLRLAGLPVTSQGLAKLAPLTELSNLSLTGTRVDDAGLAHLRGLKRLTYVWLMTTNVTDAGLVHLAELKALRHADLRGAKVTVAGVKMLQAALPGCTVEWEPPAYGLKFDPKDVVEVPGLKLPVEASYTVEGFVTVATERPETVWWSTALSGTGAYLGVIEGRWHWYTFHGAAVGPAPVTTRTHVAGVRTPTERRLYVNGKLVAKSDGGTVNPAKEEPVFRIGGGEFVGVVHEVRVSKVARYDKDFTPAERHEPDKDTLALYHCDEGTGDTLKDSSGNNHHGKITGAKWVNAAGSPDRAAAEWVIANGSLAAVFVGGQQVPCKTVADVPSTPFEVRGINVNRNKKVNDDTLACLQGLRHLTSAQITNCAAGDKTLGYIRDCKKLETLLLYASRVTDEGLEVIAGFPELKYLNIKQLRLSEPAVKKLAAALPKCRIEWDGGVIEPKQK